MQKSRQGGTETVTSVTQGNKQHASSFDSVSEPPDTGELEQKQVDRERRRLRRSSARLEDLQLESFIFYSSRKAFKKIEPEDVIRGAMI